MVFLATLSGKASTAVIIVGIAAIVEIAVIAAVVTIAVVAKANLLTAMS